jgi:hypothetical protein
MPKHPEINVELAGQDGNAFSILGRVAHAMRRAGLSDEEIAQFHDEATSGDYDNLLITVMEWVNTDSEDDEEDEEDWYDDEEDEEEQDEVES